MWTSSFSDCKMVFQTKWASGKMPFSLVFPFSSTESWPHAGTFSRHRRRGLWSVQSGDTASVCFGLIHRKISLKMFLTYFLTNYTFVHLCFKRNLWVHMKLYILIHQWCHILLWIDSQVRVTLNTHLVLFYLYHLFIPLSPVWSYGAVVRLGLPLIWVVWNFLSESPQIGTSCGCWLGSSCGRLWQASGEELQHLEKKESWLKHWDKSLSNMNTLWADPAATLFASSLLALCK